MGPVSELTPDRAGGRREAVDGRAAAAGARRRRPARRDVGRRDHRPGPGHAVRPVGHPPAHRARASPACRSRRSCTPGSATCSPTRSRSSCSARSSPSATSSGSSQVTVIVGLTSGLGTWLFASPGTIHIGASGLVFGYLTYLVVRGLLRRAPAVGRRRPARADVLRGILWGLLPRPGISWTGHVFGAVGGVLAAWYVHGREPDDADLPAT